MDRKHIDDRHLVALYLADKLTGEERTAFEAYMVEHPDLVQELEHTARLKVGLERLQQSGRLDGLLTERPWHRQPRLYAWAASIALVVVGLAMWFEARAPSQPLLVASLSSFKVREGQPMPVTATRTLLRTRGVAYDAVIDASAHPAAVELLVLPEFEAQPPVYRVTLSYMGEDGVLSERASVPGLPRGENGYVTVYLDASQLVPGRYQVSVIADTAASATGTASSFSLQVKRAR